MCNVVQSQVCSNLQHTKTVTVPNVPYCNITWCTVIEWHVMCNVQHCNITWCTVIEWHVMCNVQHCNITWCTVIEWHVKCNVPYCNITWCTVIEWHVMCNVQYCNITWCTVIEWHVMCNVCISSSLCSLYCSNAFFGADIGRTGHLLLYNMLGNSSVGELPLGHLLVVLGQVQCLTCTGHDSIGLHSTAREHQDYTWHYHTRGADGLHCTLWAATYSCWTFTDSFTHYVRSRRVPLDKMI